MTGDEGVEVSECSCCVFVDDSRINVLQVIIDKSFGIENDFVTDGVFYPDENRQPFVVRDVLMFRDRYTSCFLEYRFIIPLRVKFG